MSLMNIDLEILKLQDLLKDQPQVKKYYQDLKQLENDQVYQQLLDKYNEKCELINKTEYIPFKEQEATKLAEIEKELMNNQNYQKLMQDYEVVNNLIQNIASTIFLDIVNVKEGGCCGCK